MFKLIRNVNIVNVLKNSGIADNNLSRRSFCDAAPQTEKCINSVQLLGRAGADPQQKGTDTSPVITFSLATQSNYKTENGEWIQRVQWHNIVVFKPSLREAALKCLEKGARVQVNGRVSYHDVKNKDGDTRSITSIIADDIIFLQPQ